MSVKTSAQRRPSTRCGCAAAATLDDRTVWVVDLTTTLNNALDSDIELSAYRYGADWASGRRTTGTRTTWSPDQRGQDPQRRRRDAPAGPMSAASDAIKAALPASCSSVIFPTGSIRSRCGLAGKALERHDVLNFARYGTTRGCCRRTGSTHCVIVCWFMTER